MLQSKINFYTSYYIQDDAARQKELDFCLEANVNCESIDHLYVLATKEDAEKNPALKNKKVIVMPWESRPMYSDFFKAICGNSSEYDWNIIANSDIFIDGNSVEKLKKAGNCKKVCFALSRYEIESIAEGKINVRLLNRIDAQDTWIFYGKVTYTPESNIYLGKAGCDNKIAFILQKSGYTVINACYQLKTYHYHCTNIRTYNPEDKYHPPYHIPAMIRTNLLK